MKGCISFLLHGMNNSVLGGNVQGAMGPKQWVRSSESGSVPLATIPPSPVVVLMKGSMPWLKMLDTAFLFLLEFPSFFFVPSDFLLDSHATHCSVFSLMLCLLETPLCRSSFFFTLKGNTFPLFLVKTTCHMKPVPVLLHKGPPLLAGEGLQPSQLPPAGPPAHDPGLRPELAEESEEKYKEV